MKMKEIKEGQEYAFGGTNSSHLRKCIIVEAPLRGPRGEIVKGQTRVGAARPPFNKGSVWYPEGIMAVQIRMLWSEYLAQREATKVAQAESKAAKQRMTQASYDRAVELATAAGQAGFKVEIKSSFTQYATYQAVIIGRQDGDA